MIRSLPQPALVLAIVGLIAINMLVFRAALAPRVLTVMVFETGKGRAVLATTPSGRTLLIDNNSDASILRSLGSALPPWRRSLDVVIPLKAGAGLSEVQNRYHITRLMRSLTRGQRINFHDGTFIDVLWPASPETSSRGGPPTNVAEAPVLLLSYGTTSFLIKPIITPRIEKYLSSINSSLPPVSFIISSSTPPGTFISNGVTVKN